MIRIENLVKRYGDVVALDHFNLDVKEGEIFGLLGPNGSGKTTAINCMLALLKYDRGSIRIMGQEMAPDNYNVKRQIGIVMQDVAEKVALLHLTQLQRTHIEVVFSRRVFAQDGLPGGFQNKVHLVHPHIRDPVDEDFHIHHQPLEVGMRGKFAEQSVVDFTAA